MNSSQVSGNVILDGRGRGIDVNETGILNNSTVSGNTKAAPYGGSEGIYVSGGNLAVNSSTISGHGGPGIANAQGTLRLQNTILAGNTGFDCCNDLAGTNGNISSDPLLADLAHGN